jgi:hypothetical protein
MMPLRSIGKLRTGVAQGDIFSRWDSWLMRSAPPHALAIFRIAFAAFLLVEAATYLPHVTMMFSSAGFAISMHTGIAALAPPVPVVAWVLALGYVAALTALMVGYRTRTALVALVAYFLYYWQLSFYAFPSSYHRLFFFSFLVLLLGGSDKTFSLRMLRERGSWTAWEPVSVLPQRLLAIQLTATYAIVGWQKWWLPLWHGGDVLYYSFIGRWGTPWARRLVAAVPSPWFYDALTWATKAFETLLPFGLWIPRVRWLFFFGGFVFHIAIAVLLGIWWFLVLPPAYIVFFEPEAVHAFFKKRFPID